MKISCFFFLFALLISTASYSQSEGIQIYNDTKLPSVYVYVDADSLSQLLAPGNEESDHEYPATFIFSLDQHTDTVKNIGFRLRGNTSRVSKKKSFKISFNTFEQGRQFYGLDKMNLNGEHNDPTIMRAKLSWDLFQNIGLPAPRANHVQLYINDEYRGLYLNVEHIDDEFVENRFGTDSGNLYKCLYPADLTYRGSDPDDYKFIPSWADRRTYELKTNTSEDDYSDLAQFINFINNSDDVTFEREIENYLNVDGVIKWIAADILTGNWDNYWYNQNNYYLYRVPDKNPVSDRFHFIPYDYDNTFGIDFLGPDWGTKHVVGWGPDQSRPLVNRILSVENYNDRLHYYLKLFVDEYFNADVLEPSIDRLKSLTELAAEADTFRTLDYNFSISDYHRSFSEALDGHVEYGLKPYISTRAAATLNQIRAVNIAPIINKVDYYYSASESALQFAVSVTDESTDSEVRVVYRFDDEPGSNSTDLLTTNGADFSGILSHNPEYNTITFFISATDPEGNTINSRVYKFGYPKTVSESIKINELMSDNETTIQDDFGAYEDWVELYNPLDTEVNLIGFYLTDDFNDPKKWAFPDTTIPAGGFLLVWTDNDDEEGPLHTNFALSNDGEELGLFYEDGLSKSPVDTLSFGPLSDDISFGRLSDGDSVFVSFLTPTPGFSNSSSVATEPIVQLPTFRLLQNYPNPFNPETTISFQLAQDGMVTLKIFDALGREIAELTHGLRSSGTHRVSFDASHLSSGIYYYRLDMGAQFEIKKMMLIK
tara:strand:- start:175545 stop:177851 length:2307 start_codon:yes stop_codon:yes gene_type:complete